MGEVLSDVIRVCEERTAISFLDDLLKEEVARKEQRRVETTLKISGLPFIKTIDEFDFSFQPALDRRNVMSLFDLTFVRGRRTSSSWALPGLGKTHLAVSWRSRPVRHRYVLHHHGGPHCQAEEGSCLGQGRQCQELPGRPGHC